MAIHAVCCEELLGRLQKMMHCQIAYDKPSGNQRCLQMG